MPYHRDLPINMIHPPHSFEYPNDSQRLNASGFTANDLDKICWQKSDDSYWRLASITPTTWVYFTSVHGCDAMLSTVAVESIDYNDNSDPILIKWVNGFKCTITYDLNEKPNGVIFTNPQKTIVEQWDFNYNTDGNLISSNRLI